MTNAQILVGWSSVVIGKIVFCFIPALRRRAQKRKLAGFIYDSRNHVYWESGPILARSQTTEEPKP